MAALLVPVSFAAQTMSADEFAKLPGLSAKRLTGSFTAGYDTNYVGRGLVISHSVAEGDSSEMVALKMNYDIGKKQQQWSIDSAIAYRTVTSGHTLYGPRPYAALRGALAPKNVENEFAVVTAIKYSGKYGAVSLGHDFIRGGLLGAMAKHFRDQGASCVNEIFLSPVVTPTQWLEAGCTVRLSFQGIQGYWYEPYVTFKAPIIGTAEDVKMAALLTFAMSATSNYFDPNHHANANGAQAWWIKLATPYFVNKHFVITPSVSFNWLGDGAQKAQKVSRYRTLPAGAGRSTYVPYRNFAVVAGVNCSYVF